ncbi:MAG: coiled-coil domain-containing protein, partial [Planctomycetota bacterium]
TSIALMIQSNIDLSNAVNLAAEAQNAAVIAGVDSSEAFRRLVFVITSGNVRMARTLGLQVSFQDAYEKTAESLGKTTLELTQQEKVQARTAEVLKAGTRIVGAYDAAMETAGKKVTSLNRHIEESTRIMGELFLPLFADAVDVLTEFLEGIEEASVAQQRGIAATVAATSAVAGLSGVTLLFLSQLPGMIAGLQKLGIVLTATTGIVGVIIAAFVAMGVAAVKASAESAVLRRAFRDLAIEVAQENESFGEYERRVFAAAEGTTVWSNALRLSERTGKSFNEALRILLAEQGLYNEEQLEAERATIQAAIAQEALVGALRGVGTELRDQISDIRLSEISYRDYVEQVEDLAEANDLTAITTEEFIDQVNRGISPVEILSRSVLIASERHFDFADAAEQSDRKLLGLLGAERDAKTATELLAEKLGITEEELLDVAEAAGIATDKLDEIPEDVEIQITAQLEKEAQEKIQAELARLQLSIDTELSIDFGDFQAEVEDINQELDDLEFEKIEEIAKIEAEGAEDLEDIADKIDDLNDRRGDEIFRLGQLEDQLDLAKQKLAEMGDETDELSRRSQEARVEGLTRQVSEQKEAIAEVIEEIGELNTATGDAVTQQGQDLTELEATYLEKARALVANLDEVTEAWDRQTKQLIFNLAVQRFGLDGIVTDEELDAITQLAGPGGLGLIDEAGVALLDTMDDLNDALAEPGDQAPLITGAFNDIHLSMQDPKQTAADLAANIRDIGAATLELARLPRFQAFGTLGLGTFPLSGNRAQGGPVRRGQAYRVGETGEELFVPSQSGIVVPSALTKALTGLVTSATSAIPVAGAGSTAGAAAGGTTTQNFNMSINTQAPAEQIAADFNLLALMGERRA